MRREDTAKQIQFTLKIISEMQKPGVGKFSLKLMIAAWIEPASFGSKDSLQLEISSPWVLLKGSAGFSSQVSLRLALPGEACPMQGAEQSEDQISFKTHREEKNRKQYLNEMIKLGLEACSLV